jgi:hypothetical protein
MSKRNFDMITEKSWQEFRNTGLLWWINTLLHTFGWAIVVNVEEDGSISNCFPSRVKFRGFDEKANTLGYQKVSKFLKENIDDIEKESNE